MEILLFFLLIGSSFMFYFYRKNTKNSNINSHESISHYESSVPTPQQSQSVPIVKQIIPILDENKDGKVDVTDFKEVAKKTHSRVKKAADLDGDGKVTKADAKAAVKTVVKKVRANKSKA